MEKGNISYLMVRYVGDTGKKEKELDGRMSNNDNNWIKFIFKLKIFFKYFK